MATTYIPIDTSIRLGSALRITVDQVRQALDGLGKLRGIMETMINANDYTQLEKFFGLAPGDGFKAHFQVAAILDSLATNDPKANLKDMLNQLLTQLG